MTHQVNLKAPGFEQFFRKRFHRLIEQFDELWIPDFEQAPGLASELSHGPPLNIKTNYIGSLSRFEPQDVQIQKNTMIAVLSGPEPQRSIFEQRLLAQIENLDLECTLIRGLPNSKGDLVSNNVKVIDHLPAEQLAKKIAQSEFIVCRSGYSTIMDLYTLGRSAILVPTPGQSEQEYLAFIQDERICLTSEPQHKFDLNKLLRMIRSKRPDKTTSAMTEPPVEDRSQVEDLQIKHPA